MGRAGELGHGVVGVGDSFMNGYGLPLAGLSCTSWGGWLAWALMTCLTQLAVDGATAEQVLRDQTPLLQPHGYRLGVVWVGANDIAGLDGQAFSHTLRAIQAELSRCCQTVAIATLPAALTGPAATQRVHLAGRIEANAVIRAVAAAGGSVLVELEHGLSSTWDMAPDCEHPTGIGQLRAAHVAAVALDQHGLHFARHLPAVTALQPTSAERRLYRRRSRPGWVAR